MVAITVNPSTSEHSSPSQDSSQADDPLFLHHGECPGAVLVSQPIFGENYPAWACSIKEDLISKNKLGLSMVLSPFHLLWLKLHHRFKLGFKQITW